MSRSDWINFLYQVRKDPNWVCAARLLALDPGETTGWSVWADGSILDWGQLDTKDQYQKTLMAFFEFHQPTHVVCEDYKVYEHKLKQHTWASLHTPQLIGAVKMLAVQNNLPMHLQMASMAKGFCTDDKLRRWGIYQPGMRHARDSIRHACYYLLLNKQEHNGYNPSNNG